MSHCVTCNSEIIDASRGCLKCGTAVDSATGTVATVAMVAEAAAATTGRASLLRLPQTAIADEGRFPPGTLVNGRYRIVGLLGRGGMGEVYRATDLALAQAVALKFLPEAGVSERVLERFHAEVRIARQVSHPNICRVYDIGEVDGQPFISMEYVDGEDLADLLQRIGRLPADKALETARKICAGLAAAHDKGVIHRDLKPQNIMLNKRGEPVIMDFGLAAVADQLTGAEARNGTPAYMSPEQLRGDEVTAKSDIYALGLVLYEIFSGRRAYEAKTIGDLLKLQEGEQITSLTSLAADVDPQVEKVVKRCLNPNPALRPATPLAVAAALPGGDPLAAALAAGETPSPELVAASGKTEGMDLRYSVPLFLAVLAVIIGAPFWSASHSFMEMMPRAYSPAVAGHEARRIAESFGYSSLPRDSFITGRWSPARTYWMSHDRQGKSWSELTTAEPFYDYYYRESPALLAALPDGTDIGNDNPAPTTAGMIRVVLNCFGHLRRFEAVPPEQVDGTPGAPLDEDALFRAIGYDRSTFTETAPERVPLVMADFRKAWKGPAPGLPGIDVRVEAGSVAGKLTAAKVTFPWTPPERKPPAADPASTRITQIGRLVFNALFEILGLIFAMRNLRLNRGDRKGAFRVAMTMGLLVMSQWLGQAHHVPSADEWSFFIEASSEALFRAAVVWTMYIALEPAVRARWPHSLVAWNRLLAGRLGDAQVGWHILVGAALGILFWFGFLLTEILDGRLVVPGPNSLLEAQGTLAWFGWRADTLRNGLRYGMFVFFGVVAFRLLLKNDYVAALTAAIVFALIDNPSIWSDNQPWLSLALLVGIYAVIAQALLRMGIIPGIMSLVVVNSMGRISIDTHLSSWYTPYGLATMTLLVGMVSYGFWRSIGSRKLGDDTV